MKFTKFSDDNSESYFFSQPHQPFFILAFVNALITMFIFLLSYKGVLNIDISPVSFHAYGLMYLLFTPAFLAFLFTTFPRFASTPILEKKVYMRVFSFYYLGSVLFLLGSIVSPLISAAGMLILFVGHALGVLILKNIYTTTTMEDKQDIYWILLAMVMGVGSHFLFILGEIFNLSLFTFSTEIANYLYLFFLAFAVAQRMVPFFSHCMVEKDAKLLSRLFGLLVLHVVLESIYTNASFVVDLGIAYLVGKELLRWKLPFPNPNPLLTILHLSLYWVPVAFTLGGLTNFISLISDVTFLALDIHVLILGFVFTILIGFGTRVTIGHSGNMMQADKWVKYLFIWTQIVVGLRILVSIVSAFGWNYMILFDISVAAWLVMFIAWAVRFFAVLITGKKLT